MAVVIYVIPSPIPLPLLIFGKEVGDDIMNAKLLLRFRE